MTTTADPDQERRQVSITLPAELHTRLLKSVKAADLTIVQWVRQAIRMKLQQEEE
jgi:hypothetical protein